MIIKSLQTTVIISTLFAFSIILLVLCAVYIIHKNRKIKSKSEKFSEVLDGIELEPYQLPSEYFNFNDHQYYNFDDLDFFKSPHIINLMKLEREVYGIS